MKKISRIVATANENAKKYNVPTIAHALCVTEGCISGYFSNRGVTTRGGLTAEQVSEFLGYYTSPGGKRGAAINQEDIPVLLEELASKGWGLVEE